MRADPLMVLTLAMSYRPVLCAPAFFRRDRLEDVYNRAKHKAL